MKTHNYINKFLITGLLCSSVGLVSCDDFLTVLPTNQITEEDFWENSSDVDNVRAGVYRQMTYASTTGRIIYWGELRADNTSLYDMTQQDIQHLQQGILMPTDDMFDWTSFYAGINYCNIILEKGEAMTEPGNEVDPTFRRSDWKPIKAEMVAMRALNYFYLVRAYRDVPYVTAGVYTDKEAAARKDGATSGANVLGYLIKDLEEVLPYAADNFGSTSENQARITRRGIQALLADIYLWRGCLLKNNDKKTKNGKPADYVLSDTGDTLTTAECTALSTECFKKSIAYCDDVMTYMDSVYQEKQKNSFSGTLSTTTKYPYLARLNSHGGFTSTSDQIYAGLWGVNASSNYDSNAEIIFQLVYDGDKVTNDTPYTYFYNYSSSWTTGYLTSASSLSSSAKSSYDPDRGFGKTDIRLLESLMYSSTSSSAPIIHKYALSSLSISDYEDMTAGSSTSYSTERSMAWPIYRLTDVMLIKAEAIARSVSSSTTALEQTTANASKDGYLVTEGFNLVNAIFERNNPKLQATGTEGAGNLVSDRLKTDYAYESGSEKTADDLLTLVYNERQREFVGEGKRWFDIVRECEADYTDSNDDILSKYITLSTTVRNRLKSLYSLYNPIYSEEIKVNGVDYGGNLEQNPVWSRYSEK